ncbi:glycosyltransferase family 2 protein [Geomonas agri]|uniref:glycosyltransferase family 2 protein n=1 Tax=Geomonas agri TaxID=2873702 RepID=UPI001CD3DADD|nr:glycosyltransferase family 2 protein [Geomonas agri]
MSAEHKISPFVITKNNEQKIGGLLASLSWADEVVVVDDFSSDATPEICRSFANVRFFQNKFEGFQEQKVHAMNLTRNDWVLKMDADEEVSPLMRESIQALSDEDFATYSCFEFKRLTCFWGKWIRHGSFYPDYNPRLFHKGQGAWGGINPHDKFMTNGRTKKVDGDILHFQNWDLFTYAYRTILYSSISAEEYFKRGRRAKWHNYTVRPLWTTFYRYVIRLGFLEGVRGLVIALMGGLGTFVKYAKLLELEKKYASAQHIGEIK